MAGKPIQADLERRLFFSGFIEQGSDSADFRGHTRGRHHSNRPPRGDQRTGEDHVDPVSHSNRLICRLRKAACPLLHSEGALIYRETVYLQKPPVRRHHVPGLQNQNIPGNHLGRGDGHGPPFPDDAGLRGGKAPQAVQGFFRLLVLYGSQNRI